jgi:peptide/nickel transport system permease protein
MLLGVFVLILISILIFALLNILPGDPAQTIAGPNASPEQIATLRADMGLDRPLYERYVDWVTGFFRGDLGKSLVTRRGVAETIVERLPPTVELGILSLVLAMAIAVPVGVYSALRRNSLGDMAGTVFALLGVSMPSFWLAILLILLFAVRLRLLPVSGYVPFRDDPIENLKLMIMPAATLGMGSTALVLRQIRSSMLDVLHQDYVRTAWAKGLRERTIVFRHALRNALIPVLTVFGFQVGVIFGGAVITETIFAIPGMGRLMVDSIQLYRDWPVIQSLALVGAALVLLTNLAVDLIYAYVDPRIRLKG